MKKKEFEELIITKIPKLYHFSYALLPDDLQAQQIVIDAFTILTISEKESFKSFLYSFSEGVGNLEGYPALNESLFRNCYKLGFKRYFQLHESFHFENSSKGKFGPFYMLEIKERALVFLKDKTNFSVREIGLILGMKESDAEMRLNSARMKFIKLLGFDQENFLES